MNTVPPHLVTFPRSGSHYFDRLIYEKAKFHIERSHIVNHLFDKNNNKTRRIITIARDPKESIHSLLALHKFLSNQDRQINETLTEYILLYSFLYENADYVIDFKDLVEYPDLVTEKILDLLEINEENSGIFVTNIDYNRKNGTESSKMLSSYGNISLDQFNIDLCYFHYHRLLEKKINIEKK
jgi:hypothetical protein